MRESILPPALDQYLHSLVPTTDPVQRAMEAEGERRGFPIIGPVAGRLVAQWAAAIGAERAFDMGSGFGYSALHLARAMGPNGRVVHTEGSKELSREAQEWLGKAGLSERVEFRLGDARDLLRGDAATYDLVTIDIDKEQYPEAWRIACDKVRVGGVVVTDNTLWKGRVAGAATDEATRGVVEYNRLAFGDERFVSSLVPVRDGVTVSLRVR